jgi:hypothetical protein
LYLILTNIQQIFMKQSTPNSLKIVAADLKDRRACSRTEGVQQARCGISNASQSRVITTCRENDA